MPEPPDFNGPCGLGYAPMARERGGFVLAIGLWRSLVARVVRDDEAAGSNPVSPTDRHPGSFAGSGVSSFWSPAGRA
ncbi:hypothetical protein NOCA280062 [metagenome]|uniref:Uncharacterized protein n=1 Tax=metagenome TaxID=256318 RepID=A0A2P2CFE8_9ZZZZ